MRNVIFIFYFFILLHAVADSKSVKESYWATGIDMKPFEPILGNPNAKVFVYIHSDLECLFCAKAKKIIHEIKQEYGEKVAIVFRHLPHEFHPNAKPAAIASICAQEQGKFWEFHDKLLDNQINLSRENFLKWANELNLNDKNFKNCLGNPETQKKLETYTKIPDSFNITNITNDTPEVTSHKITGTPTFVIGSKKEGIILEGLGPYNWYKGVIDSALKNY
jgi:protein-disulfide isomerase